MGNSKADIDNVWAFLDDVLTPDAQNVAQRQETKRVQAKTKTNLGGTVQKIAGDVIDFGSTVVKETAGVAKGGLTLAGNANENANETLQMGLQAVGTPGGKALAVGAATALGGPAAGALANQFADAFGPAAPATPAPAPAPPTTFPGTPKTEDNTGKVLLGVGFLAALGYAFSRRGKDA